MSHCMSYSNLPQPQRSDVNMEEKVSNAIQHRSKFKKRLMSQRSYSFNNKGAVLLESNSLHDFMFGLEIDVYISKRGKGESASYFVTKKFVDSS